MSRGYYEVTVYDNGAWSVTRNGNPRPVATGKTDDPELAVLDASRAIERDKQQNPPPTGLYRKFRVAA